MISQNRLGLLTVGDSHEYGLAPDPFDRKHINDLIQGYLQEFATLKNPKLVETWNGVYAKCTDGRTDIFYSPETDVFIVNGVGAGMTLSFDLLKKRSTHCKAFLGTGSHTRVSAFLPGLAPCFLQQNTGERK